MDYKKYIASVEGFPKEGIIFRDVTPILEKPEVLSAAVKEMAQYANDRGADVILGPEARGFIFGVPVALEAGLGFAPVRKPGKLPRKTISQEYELEYGTDTLCMHEDAVKPGQKIVIIDDLLATGGTVGAIIKMIRSIGAEVVGCAFVIELDDLHGRDKLDGVDVFALTHYEGE
jgi:adenine phosphoribosyltransferase